MELAKGVLICLILCGIAVPWVGASGEPKSQVDALADGTLDPSSLSPEQMSELLVELAKRLKVQEERFNQFEARLLPYMPPTEEEENAAKAILDVVNEQIGDFAFDQARATIRALAQKHPKTQAAMKATRNILPQLAAIGQQAGPLSAEYWFQGNASMHDGIFTLLVFWEVWCPHCIDEMPKLQELYDQFKDAGINLVGITTVSNEGTPEKVRAFLRENGISFPIAKDNGYLSKHFLVSNIPAAAVIKDGVMIWRGHPDQCDRLFLERLLSGLPGAHR